MPPGRNYSGAVVCGLVLSIILLSIALATRCWVYGYIMFVDFTIGLFTTSVDGTVYNTQDLYPGLKDEIDTVIILEGVGGGLSLVALITFSTFLLRQKKHVIHLAAAVSAALASGVLLIAGAAYFYDKIGQGGTQGYSWYLAIFSGVSALSSVINVGLAVGKGELIKFEPRVLVFVTPPSSPATPTSSPATPTSSPVTYIVQAEPDNRVKLSF